MSGKLLLRDAIRVQNIAEDVRMDTSDVIGAENPTFAFREGELFVTGKVTVSCRPISSKRRKTCHECGRQGLISEVRHLQKEISQDK
jgi:hypothetical protein